MTFQEGWSGYRPALARGQQPGAGAPGNCSPVAHRGRRTEAARMYTDTHTHTYTVVSTLPVLQVSEGLLPFISPTRGHVVPKVPLGLTGLISLQSKGLSSLLQHHSSKAKILPGSAFFIVQLRHPYIIGETIALTR